MDNTELSLRRATVSSQLRDRGVAAAVVTDPRDFEYLSGADPCRGFGPSPFTGPMGAALIIGADGSATVLGGAPGLRDIADESGLTPAEFPTFEDLEPLRPRRRLGEAVERVLAQIAPSGAVIGVEPGAPVEGLERSAGADRRSWRFVEVESVIGAQRAIKSTWEIERLRRAVRVCDEAQRAAAEAVDHTAELSEVRRAVEATLTRQDRVSSWLIDVEARSDVRGERLNAGAFVITDIAPRIDAYWGDSCDTRPWQGGVPEDARTHEAVRAALVAGVDLARPGIRACELDAVMREQASRGSCGPYTGAGGHGLGLDFHEMPRLTPYDQTVLQPNMVLALEPGAYGENIGVRLEAVVLVVPGGCEVLSSHLGSLP